MERIFALMTTATRPLPALVDHSAHPHRWWLLAFLSLAQLMVLLDATIVNIALPEAQVALGLSDAERTWVVTIYALAFGALLLLGGRIADYWGRKRSFLLGLSGFAVASIIGGLATTSGQLLLARGLQGAFAALLAPAALAILTLTFPSGKDRIKAFTVFGTIGGVGAAVGLLLGGVLTEYASWHWSLLVNVPIALIGLAGAIPLMRESRAHGNTRYDIPGAVLVVLGLGSLVYGFAQAEHGWGRTETILFLALGVVLLAAFVRVESRVSNPLLPLRVVVDRVRGGAFLVSMVLGAGSIGALLFLTIYLQVVLRFTPLQSSLASLPLIATLMITATILSGVLPRTGVRLPMTIGPVIGAAGLVWLSRITVEGNYAVEVLPGVVLLGIGVALAQVPLQNVALARIGDRDAGVASAAVTATQQIGGSIGAALFTALYAAAITAYLASHPAGPTVQLEAFVSGYSTAFLWAAGFFLVAAPISFFSITVSRADLVKAHGNAHLG
jgi:EmrB/QacA subfamily drug resistance transporter